MDDHTTRRPHVHTVGGGILEISTGHGEDWFPVNVAASDRAAGPVLQFFLNRAGLRELRGLVTALDEGLPEPAPNTLDLQVQP